MGQIPVLVAAPAAVLTALLLDLTLGGDLGLLFGLAFVTACVGIGLLADPRQFYLAALVPPLTMLVCLLAVGLLAPAALGVPGAGGVAGVVAGFAHHSWALGVGYLLCLAGLGARLTGSRGSAPALPAPRPPDPHRTGLTRR